MRGLLTFGKFVVEWRLLLRCDALVPYFGCTSDLKQRRIAALPVFRKCVAPSLSSYEWSSITDVDL